MFTLNCGHAAIAKCAAKETSRYAINGVHLSRCHGGGMAVATNGRALVSVACKADPDAHAVIIPQKDFARVSKARKAEAVITNGTPNSATITIGSESAQVATDEGHFPSWRECIPKAEPKFAIRLDVDLLIAVLECATQWGNSTDSDSRCVTLTFTAENQPVMITQDDSERPMIGLVMPVKPDAGIMTECKRLADGYFSVKP